MSSLEKIKLIEDITGSSPNRLREKYFNKNYPDIFNEILSYTKDLDLKFPFRVWHWVNDVPHYVKCYCGKRVSTKMNWKDGYKSYCSNKCSANSENTKDKLKKTNLEKWGVDHYSKTQEYKEKVKSTSLEKWGVDNYSKTKEYIDKSKHTYLKKWGVDNYTKTDEYLEKSKNTSLQNWGVEFPIQSDIIKDKIRKTNLKKHGSTHIFGSKNYRDLNFKIANHPNYIKFSNGYNYFNCDCEKNHTFKISTDDFYGRIKSNNKLCTYCYPISSSSSIKEDMLFQYINSIYNSKIIRNYRISRLEIDIFLPQISIGFEFNGLWWHSDKYKNKEYHLKKTNFFKEKGIRIIHIWEDDWVNKSDIIKSQIKSWLGLTENKIWARKCEFREIDKKLANEFLNNNHIQGSDKSTKKVGLFYNNEMVSVMTFNKFEGRNKMNDEEWNLSRFCNKVNSSVVGGASKLLKNFIRLNSVKRVITYADKDWSVGNLYESIGFTEIGHSKPDYKYFYNNVRTHKSNFKKSKTGISESNLEIPKIWDNGKIKYEKIIK